MPKKKNTPELEPEVEATEEVVEETTENNEDTMEEVVEETVKETVEEVVAEREEETPINVDTDDDKIPLDPETGLDPEQLKSDLEGLRDLFQGEIDKMMDGTDADWKSIVKAAKDEKMAARLGLNKKMCECCGERPANEDGVYCDECLEGMKHYPFKWWNYLIPVVAVIMVFLSCSFFAISFSVFRQTVEAQKLVGEHKLLSALEMYDNINAEIRVLDSNYGYKYLRNQVEIYDTIGIDAYEDLNTFIDKYYTGTALSKKRNAYVAEIQEDVKSYTKLYEYFEEAAESSKDYDSFVTSYDALLEDKEYNAALAAYYKYYASLVYNEGAEVQRSNVDAIKVADPEMKSLYLPLYAELALNEGEYDDVLLYASEMEEYHSENIYVWLYRSLAHRLKGNISLAANACNEGLEIMPGDPNINYQMAIISLLQGQNKTALHYAEIAYANADTQNSFVASGSMYALCAALNNDTEAYNTAVEEAESYGYKLSPDVKAIVEGTKTVEDVFATGKGDFEWE